MASGVVEDRFGRRKCGFEARFHGEWCDGLFLLYESFVFCDGRTEERTWRIIFDARGNFTTTCADVVGQGTGHHTEDGCRHNYTYRFPVGNRTITMIIDESYYASRPGHLLYRARLKKWGVLAGTILISFAKSR